MLINVVGYITLAVVLLFVAGVIAGHIKCEFTVTKDDDEDFDIEYTDKFKAKMERTKRRLVEFAERTRKEGILACEALNSQMLLEDKDLGLLNQGMQMAVDGTEPKEIERFFNNVILCADNYLEEIYAETIKQGIIMIAMGNNLKFVEYMLDSFDIDREIL